MLWHHQRTQNDVLPLCVDQKGMASSSTTRSRAQSDPLDKERKKFSCATPDGARESMKHTLVDRCHGVVRTCPLDSPLWQLGLALVLVSALQLDVGSVLVLAVPVSGVEWAWQ